MNTKELLIEARRLLQEVGWCQLTNASKNGNSVSIFSNEADSFCIYGAITKASNPKVIEDIYDTREPIEIIRNAIPPNFDKSITLWNDHPDRTKEEVINLFDNVIDSIE